MKINQILLAMLAVAIFWSCEKSENPEANEVPQNSLEKKNFRGMTIEVENLGDGTYLWGDIVLSKNQFHNADETYDPFLSPEFNDTKLNLGSFVTKWPNNTVIYEISSNVTNDLRGRIQESFNEWDTKTNIQFRERTDETDYVRILSNGSECNCGRATLGLFSFNGDTGFIELGNNASNAVIIHEIGHTLGYTHEQNRADRDQYITIFPENITSSGLSQYQIDQNSTTLTEVLDPNSIMMYRSTTFGNGNGPTMIINATGEPVPGFGDTITVMDIEGTNKAYPSGDTGGICDGIDEWQPGVGYQIGDQVVYQGNLWERVFQGWRFLGPCD